MPACAVYGCGNYSRKTKGSDIRYYSFPKDEHLCKQWINVCCRQDKFNVHQGRICSKHFHPTAFFKTLKHELLEYAPKTGRNLKQDAIPTEFLPNQKKSFDTSKNERRQERDEIQNRALIISESLDKVTETSGDTPDKLSDSTECCLSDMKNVIDQLKKDNMSLRKENETLQQNLASVSTELDFIQASLRKHVGPDQLKHLMNPAKNFQWTPEDVASAISFRSVSPKVYRCMCKNGYPLPAPSTLRKWALHLRAHTTT